MRRADSIGEMHTHTHTHTTLPQAMAKRWPIQERTPNAEGQRTTPRRVPDPHCYLSLTQTLGPESSPHPASSARAYPRTCGDNGVQGGACVGRAQVARRHDAADEGRAACAREVQCNHSRSAVAAGDDRRRLIINGSFGPACPKVGQLGAVCEP